MKFFQKAVSILATTVLITGVTSTQVLAEGNDENAYPIYIVPSVDSAAPDDIVSIKVCTNATAKISSFTFDVIFDQTALEYQNDSLKKGNDVSDWALSAGIKDVSNGKIIINLASEEPITDKESEIIEASFKVLKPNGTINIVLDVVADVNGDDITNLFSTSGISVKCSHKNTETKTEITDCEKGGKSVTTCKDCGETVKTEDIAPSEHKIDSWTETKKATCTEKGEKEGVCTVCGKTVTQELEKLEHKFGEWKVTKPATCTEKGIEERTCELCGVEKETREIEMTEHEIEWTVEKEASCTEAGEKKGVCSVCGSEFTEDLPALGHSWGDWETVTEPTVDSEGLEQRKCGRCGETEERSIAKLPETPTTAPVTTPSEAPDVTTEPSVTTAPNDSGSSGDNNLPTGAAIAVVPLAAVCAAVVIISKKRK